jgi:hypothetical protein
MLKPKEKMTKGMKLLSAPNCARQAKINPNIDTVPTAARNNPSNTASPESAAIKNSAEVNAATNSILISYSKVLDSQR